MEAATVHVSSAPAALRLRYAAAAGGLAVAFALRVALAWRHVTPVYVPDEYLYSALGRSLGQLDGATVRGAPAHFPALLQPLLTAPFWRIGSVETAFRVIQVVQSAAFTVAAVPAYLLARTTGARRTLSIAVAAGALVVPDALYSGYVLAEAFAYPLALGALVVGVNALARPRPRTQLLFLVLSGLAAFARVQLAVLPICFVASAVVLGLHERRVRAVLREQRLPLAAVGTAGLALFAVAVVRGLGYYAGALHLHFDFASIGKNGIDLLYAGGWVAVPAAAVGIWIACRRPRSREENAFGLLTVTVASALLLEAAIWGDTSLVQERYVFYVLPLMLVGFCVQATHGWPLRREQAIIALCLLVISVRVSLPGWSRPGLSDHAPFLLGFARLEIAAGVTGAAWIVAAASGVLCLVAAIAPQRPKLAEPLLLGLALSAAFAALLGATGFDHLNSLVKRDVYLPSNRSWIDAAAVGPATLVEPPHQRRIDGEEQLFWNKSLRRVALLPSAAPPDALSAVNLAIGSDGTLSTPTGPLRGPVVVGTDGSTVRLRDARRVASSPADTLWLPRGDARLRLYVVGRSDGGLLWSGGRIRFWSRSAGRLLVTVRGRDVVVGGHQVHGSKTLAFAVCSAGETNIPFSAALSTLVDGRPAGGRMSLPRFVVDEEACKERSGAKADGR